MLVNGLYSNSAEQIALSALFSSEAIRDFVLDSLHEKDFYHIENKLIFSTAVSLKAKFAPVEPVSIAEDLKQRGKLDQAGGAE